MFTISNTRDAYGLSQGEYAHLVGLARSSVALTEAGIQGTYPWRQPGSGHDILLSQGIAAQPAPLTTPPDAEKLDLQVRRLETKIRNLEHRLELYRKRLSEKQTILAHQQWVRGRKEAEPQHDWHLIDLVFAVGTHATRRFTALGLLTLEARLAGLQAELAVLQGAQVAGSPTPLG